eukprot:6311391-Lingulodinium_polyedra.AAC.1
MVLAQCRQQAVAMPAPLRSAPAAPLLIFLAASILAIAGGGEHLQAPAFWSVGARRRRVAFWFRHRGGGGSP